LANDPVLFAEYQLLQNNVSHEKHFITPIFRFEILNPYKELLKTYALLREQMVKLIDSYVFSAIFSPIGLGLLFLIGTAIVHCIDKIALNIKHAKIEKNIAANQAEIDNHANPESGALHTAINRNDGMLARQSLFAFNKARQSFARLDEVSGANLSSEVIHQPCTF